MSSTFRDDFYLFTDSDIDGAGCYYVLRKALGCDFGHKQTTESKFRNDFLDLKDKEQYKKIYICDLSILEKHLDIVDLPNVVYINHRNTEKYHKLSTSNLRQDSADCSSCTLLLYKKIKDKIIPSLSREEKHMIALIDDYDSYHLQFEDSKKLHFLFSMFQGDRLSAFFEAFETGFHGFTDTQTTFIQNIDDKINNAFNTLRLFSGVITIGNNNVNIYSTFNNVAPSEICEMILTKYNCDIAISVNLNTSSVSVRKNKTCDVNLGLFAKKILDGGGDSKVAGGRITDSFLELTKRLSPIQ